MKREKKKKIEAEGKPFVLVVYINFPLLHFSFQIKERLDCSDKISLVAVLDVNENISSDNLIFWKAPTGFRLWRYTKEEEAIGRVIYLTF